MHLFHAECVCVCDANPLFTSVKQFKRESTHSRTSRSMCITGTPMRNWEYPNDAFVRQFFHPLGLETLLFSTHLRFENKTKMHFVKIQNKNWCTNAHVVSSSDFSQYLQMLHSLPRAYIRIGTLGKLYSAKLHQFRIHFIFFCFALFRVPLWKQEKAALHSLTRYTEYGKTGKPKVPPFGLLWCLPTTLRYLIFKHEQCSK